MGEPRETWGRELRGDGGWESQGRAGERAKGRGEREEGRTKGELGERAKGRGRKGEPKESWGRELRGEGGWENQGRPGGES